MSTSAEGARLVTMGQLRCQVCKRSAAEYTHHGDLVHGVGVSDDPACAIARLHCIACHRSQPASGHA